MDGDLTIGEFARRCNLSASALRFYGECGLLRPAAVDPATGYRSYSAAQLPTAGLIRDLRGLGMAIAAIRGVLDQPASVRHKAVDEQILTLETTLADAQTLARSIHRSIDEQETAMTTMSVDGSDLARAVAQVLPAVGSDPQRPVLCGVLIEAKDDSLRLVATDSYRLAIRDVVPSAGAGEEFRAVVPADELATLADWIGAQRSISFNIGADRVVLTADGDERSLAHIDAQYPAYETILQSDATAVPLVVARAELLALLERGDDEAVRFRLGAGQLIVSTGFDDQSLPASYEGEPLDITLNAAFVGDAVRAAVGPDLVIEATAPLAPVIFRSADDGTFTTMLMPIRTR